MADSGPGRDAAAQGRAYEAEHAALRAAVSTTRAPVLADRFVRLAARADAGLVETKSAMLVSELLATDEDAARGALIHDRHAQLAALGCAIVDAARADTGIAPALTSHLVALTLAHLGEAVKWELMAGRRPRRDYAALHGLARTALERGGLRAASTLVIDGLERRAGVDALYFRVLLLDRFASGSLSRPQIEVLDAWLWEWAPSLTAAAEPAGPVLRADLDANHGLRHGRRTDSGPCLYLALAPLEALRLAVIEQFHAGRVVPTRGRAAEIRLEAHVEVLGQLRRAFAGDAARAFRHAERRADVEAWVGLEAVTRQLLADESVGRGPAAREAAAADKYDEVYDRPRRLLTLLDASATGWRFAAEAAAAHGLVVGELVALRFAPDRPCVLAAVVRCVREAEGERVQVGMRRLSHEALPARPCTLRPDRGEEGAYVFVPGEDASGRHDAFVVPLRLVESNERFHVRRGGRDFALVFDRLRRRGRGWALSGFEMVEPTPWEIVVA